MLRNYFSSMFSVFSQPVTVTNRSNATTNVVKSDMTTTHKLIGSLIKQLEISNNPLFSYK